MTQEDTTSSKMEAIADLLYDIPKDYGLVFDIVHYIVCLQGERADLGDGFEKLTRNNPLVSLSVQINEIVCPSYLVLPYLFNWIHLHLTLYIYTG